MDQGERRPVCGRMGLVEMEGKLIETYCMRGRDYFQLKIMRKRDNDFSKFFFLILSITEKVFLSFLFLMLYLKSLC